MKWYNKISSRTYALIAVLIVGSTALILYAMGQVPICKCGIIRLWHGVVFSSENSQHLSDWYTFTHIIHGFAFYFFFWLVGKRRGWPLWLCFVSAVLLESGWEMLENSDFIINRYREVTISLDYFGDSVINSVSDIFAMAFGFFLASRLRVWISLALVVTFEIMLGYYIHDNLIINIIMLIHPIEAIKNWQTGGVAFPKL